MMFKKSAVKLVRRAGFTILEMLIAVLLLVIGMVSILNIFNIALHIDNGIEKSTVALSLAQEEMELVKDAFTWESIDAFISPRTNVGGRYADFDREVTVSGDPKEIGVIVYWTDKGIDQQISLTTLMSHYNYN